MNSSAELKSRTTLLIFDPHEDVKWVRDVIAREQHRVDHLLLGGDYFDSGNSSSVEGAKPMCALLNDLCRTWGDNLTVLLGNHDIHYLEAKRWLDQGIEPFKLHYDCSGFDLNKAKMIAAELPADFWSQCRLFQLINGWLISHAGVAGIYWPKMESDQQALESLELHCQDVMNKLHRESFGILHAGLGRGGVRELGGITWQCFRNEFADDENPYPQIVGHTPSRSLGARRVGRSWCLDGNQTCYGILYPDGSLETLT